MKPLYARELTDEERQVLRQSLKSSNGFTVRRAQMLLMSADEQLKVDEIGRRVGCQGQAVRQAIHAFHREGLNSLHAKPKGNPTDRRALDDLAREQLRDLIRRSPRDLGYETSLWTLDLLAQACFEQGITALQVTGETIRATLAAMGISWRRVKQFINSPDPHYTVKKTTGLAEAAGGQTLGLVAGGRR
jgi:transposase